LKCTTLPRWPRATETRRSRRKFSPSSFRVSAQLPRPSAAPCKIRPESLRTVACQRVDDNTFHLAQGGSASPEDDAKTNRRRRKNAGPATTLAKFGVNFAVQKPIGAQLDRKSTRLNSSHRTIS